MAARYARTAYFPRGRIEALVRADPDAVMFSARLPGPPSRAGAVAVSKKALDDHGGSGR